MIRIINQVPLLAMLAVTLIGFVVLTGNPIQTRPMSSTLVIDSNSGRSTLHYHKPNLMWRTTVAIAHHTSSR